MTVVEMFKNFNHYTLGQFFVAYKNGKFGVFHSYVDVGYLYGEAETLAEAEQVRDKLNNEYGC